MSEIRFDAKLVKIVAVCLIQFTDFSLYAEKDSVVFFFIVLTFYFDIVVLKVLDLS